MNYVRFDIWPIQNWLMRWQRKVMKRKELLIVQKVKFLRIFRPKICELAKIRLMAIRKGVWFRVLSRLERGLMDLTLKVTKKVRSSMLAGAIFSIVEKLAEALESKVTRMMRKVGFTLAEKISRIAQSWGNKNAREWTFDLGFIKYLTIMKMNARATSV